MPAKAVGPWQLEGELGRGAMGFVMRGRHAETGQVAALKFLLDAQGSRLLRFEREREALRRLEHPNIVRFLDALEDEGRPVLVMELCEGKTLGEIFEEGTMPLRDRVGLIAQVARGVAAAHREGIVHRDLKPANVLVSNGVAKVADFGLAQVHDSQTITRTGGVVGTPAYMAPEQFKTADVDVRADVWALGVLLFEALEQRLPFDGETAFEVALAVREKPVPEARKADEALAEVLRRSLAKSPDDRYPTALELARDLEAWHGGRRTASGRHRAPSGKYATPPGLPEAVRADGSGAATLTVSHPSGFGAPSFAAKRASDGASRSSAAGESSSRTPILGLLLSLAILGTIVVTYRARVASNAADEAASPRDQPPGDAWVAPDGTFAVKVPLTKDPTLSTLQLEVRGTSRLASAALFEEPGMTLVVVSFRVPKGALRDTSLADELLALVRERWRGPNGTLDELGAEHIEGTATVTPGGLACVALAACSKDRKAESAQRVKQLWISPN